MTKADRIRELKQNDPSLTSREIADEVDSSPGYVREVWNERSDAEPEPEATPDDDLPESDGDADLDGLRDDGADPGGADVNPDGPLGDLIISDEWDEYECSECEATVEYLQDECDACGEKLAWWADA